MKFSKRTLKFTSSILLVMGIMFTSSCKKEEVFIDFTGSYVNQADDCYNNGYVLNVTPLSGNEVNISGIGNSPDIIIVGKTDGNQLELVTTTLFRGVLTVGGSGVLVDDVLTINYTVSETGVGSKACTGIFNK